MKKLKLTLLLLSLCGLSANIVVAQCPSAIANTDNSQSSRVVGEVWNFHAYNGSHTPANIVTGGTWWSDDPSIASVDPITGLTTAVALGHTTIHWTKDGCVQGSKLKVLSHEVQVNTEAPTTTVSCQLSINIDNVGDVLCRGGSSGTIDASVEGASDGVNFFWSGERIGPNITGLVAGSYTLTVSKAGCIGDSKVVTVDEPAVALSATATLGSPILCNGGTSTLTVSAIGGTAPYTYAVDNYTGTETTHDYSVSAGPYSYTVTDANGCTSTASGSVTEPAALTVSHEAVNLNTEPGKCGATVTLSDPTISPEGTSSVSVAYSTALGSLESGNTFLAAGVFPASVTATNVCRSVSSPFTITITDNEPPVFVPSVKATLPVYANHAGCTWTIVVPTATDNCTGTPPNVTGLITGTGLTGTIPVTESMAVGVGTYTITWTATDASNNSSAAATQIVSVLNPLNVTLAPAVLSPAITNNTQTPGHLYWGYQNPVFTATVTNANGGSVNYTWVPAGGSGCTKVCNITGTSTLSFNQAVTISDVYTCTVSATAPTFNVTKIDDVRCGSGNSKVSVCHYDNGKKVWNTLCIDASSVGDHMGHSHTQSGQVVYDYCGTCGAAHKGEVPVADAAVEINLYPNPNHGSFTMEIPAIGTELHITIVDMNGRVVETRNVTASDNGQHLEINLNNISKGIYMVQAVGGDVNFHTKLVIE